MAVSLGHGATGNKAPQQNSDINVTPFIDIMLVLLIIFMVALPPPTVNNNINMPPTPQNPPPPDPNNKPLFLSLTADGTVVVSLGMGEGATGSTAPNLDAVPEAVRAILPTAEERATKETFIRADFEVPYSGVMTLLNKLRDAGVKKIGLVGEATS
ncbi:MAG TPA: biopolymer transporter ExbD [Alphaproteobacteria bacterium]|nr:biopolymer transporter ExbD [Alphaproteobacteria bacterium]